jgi:hypothetical protein
MLLSRLCHSSATRIRGSRCISAVTRLSPSIRRNGLGEHVDLFFESFSTSLAAGELLVILAGEVRKHIVMDSDPPDCQINVGRLRYEESSPINNWSDIWTFVEDDHWQNEVP